MRLVAGAYPCHFADAAATAEFLSLLGRDERYGALELPIRGTDDPLAWPAGAPADWGAVITQIPGTMGALGKNPTIGLASIDADGRAAAIAFARYTLERAQALRSSGHRVIAVEMHSAPTRSAVGRGAPELLAASLREITSWDWGDTAIVVEHCDAPREGQAAQKGFLELVDEIEVARELAAGGNPVGICLNWARSAIEARSAGAGLAHLVQAREAGVLSGVMFSSVSPEQTSFGHAWIDAHLAPLGVPGAPDSSLLDEDAVRACLAELPDNLVYLGAKVGLEGLDTPASRAAAWGELAALLAR